MFLEGKLNLEPQLSPYPRNSFNFCIWRPLPTNSILGTLCTRTHPPLQPPTVNEFLPPPTQWYEEGGAPLPSDPLELWNSRLFWYS